MIRIHFKWNKIEIANVLFTNLTLAPPENTHRRGCITVQLTSCLFCMDSAALLMFNLQHICLVKSNLVKHCDTSPLR